ncbi:hypothetical protein DPEC_G00155200 [Dallia pectoralis]|uniref:Uncharacterized protein n=1 Tax=Dallia pectoralis TaxID=75939 RepID=A0ACC2GK03_DALPE|nr:hypothetical protein DPEC_G00155200 [Dallia pectoralis]
MSPTTLPPLVCINGGELQNGVCICPDEWTGVTCSKENFCSSTNIGIFSFPRTTVGWFGYSAELCGPLTTNAGVSEASARCVNVTGSPKFGRVEVLACGLTLSDITDMISNSSADLQNLAFSTQILTSIPDKLSADNISTAANIANRLLRSNTTQDIAVSAITTISQLLNSSVKSIQDSTNVDSLPRTLEEFSQQSNVSLIVQPNLVVQSARFTQDTVGIEFTAFTGISGNFVANRIHLNTNTSELISGNGSTDVQMVIRFTPVLSREDTDHSVGFVLYQNDRFFKSKAFQPLLGTNRRVLSANFGNISGLGVEMFFKPTSVRNASLYDFACVWWNHTLEDWSTYGCSKVNHSKDGLQCFCNHTTNFAVLMSFRPNFVYAKVLNWISALGCSMSVIGLGLTIIFHIVTRNEQVQRIMPSMKKTTDNSGDKTESQKTTLTLHLVCICTSNLISTLLFMTAVKNPNKQLKEPEIQNINSIPASDIHSEPDTGLCTAVTALLQYFLLGTFTWSTLFATHVFPMIQSWSSSLQHFSAYTMIIGWGVPAVIVALSLGISYRPNHPLGYRQEEFCWLAALDFYGNFDFKLPLFWGFLIPVAFMIVLNTGMLIYFAVILSKPDQNVNSTSHISVKKKILQNFSLVVVSSLSWTLGYFLLITHDETMYTILNIIFCLLTTTQGIQIFFMFTARTAIVKEKFSSSLKAMSRVDIPLHTKKYGLRWGKRRQKFESYKSLDDSVYASTSSSTLQTVSST